MRRLLISLIPLVIGLASAHHAFGATAGHLDKSFGKDGWTATGFGGHGAHANSLAIQDDGRIVLAGTVGQRSFALARYRRDGKLDRSFSRNGKVVTGFGYRHAFGEAVALQGNGKIVVAGMSNSAAGYDCVLARYRRDGRLDRSFAGDGRLVTDLGGDGAGCRDVAIQGGKIVAAAYVREGGSDYLALARFNRDGRLDPSFSDDGVATDFDGFGTALDLQSDGRLVIADHSFAVARYDSGGTPDKSFSDDGWAAAPNLGRFSVAGDVEVKGDGTIIEAGLADQPSSGGVNFAVVQFDSSGNLDPSFAGDGIQTTDFGTRADYGGALAVEPDGRIVVVGTVGLTGSGMNANIGLVRYRSNGELDPRFSHNGKVITDLTRHDLHRASDDYAEDVTLLRSGKLLVTGSTDNRFVLLRYLG